MKRIQSKKHKLETCEIDKISLSCFDNKRYVLDDGIYTLSYFRKNSVKNWLLLIKDFDYYYCDYYYYYYYLLLMIIDNYLLLLMISIIITYYYWWLFVIIDNYYCDKINLVVT